MAKVRLVGDEVVVRFGWWERLFTRCGALRVPMREIREVRYLTRPLAEVQGTRSGLVVLGLLKVGRWSDGRLVSVRRGAPGLRLVLEGRFSEVVVSTGMAAELAVEIRPGVVR